ncbi:MAG: ABC transporter permease [Planctomycetota bacterium]|jgi:putative ABC transport system permease protein
MHQLRVIRNIWSGIENLLLHKLRSLLTMLGIVFGVGSVVAMLSVGEGASKEALDQIRKLGSNNIIISAVKAVEDEASTTVHSHMSIYGLTYEDYARVNESFNTIRRSAPVKLMRKQSRFGERSLELRVVGTTPVWFELVPRPIIAGRVLMSEDEEKQAPVAVLTEFGARKILATEHTIGEFIRIGRDVFEVVGIVQSEGGQAGNIQIPDQQVDVYISMEVARKYFGDIVTRRTI